MFELLIDGYQPVPNLSTLEGLCDFLQEKLVGPVSMSQTCVLIANPPDAAIGLIQMDVSGIDAGKANVLKSGLHFWLSELDLTLGNVIRTGPFLSVHILENPNYNHNPTPVFIAEAAADDLLLHKFDAQKEPDGSYMLHARKAVVLARELHSDLQNHRIAAKSFESSGSVSQPELLSLVEQVEQLAMFALSNHFTYLKAIPVEQKSKQL